MNIIKRFYAAIKSGLTGFITSLFAEHLSNLRKDSDAEIAKLRDELGHVRQDLHAINGSKFGKAVALKSAKS